MYFSVIIPTCNRPADLLLCLERLEPGFQKYSRSDYEIIVTDDGDGDAVRFLIESRFPGVRWTRGPRLGPAANRNHGAGKAVGEWLIFTDDDCLPAPSFLSSYGIAFKQELALVLEGCTLPYGCRSSFDQECPMNDKGGYLWSCNFALKRDFFIKLGGFDTDFPGPAMEDVELHVRIKKAGVRPVFIPGAVVFHPWRSRKGMRFLRIYAKSVSFFVKKHPDQSFQYDKGRLLYYFIGQSIRDLFRAIRFFKCKGFLRFFLLNLYTLWLLTTRANLK